MGVGMNDYKELIERLNAISKYLGFDSTSCVCLAANTIEQLVKERDAESSGMCKFHITGFESSENWERYQYSSDAPVDVTVFAKSKKEAIEKAEKVIGCPISTTNRYIVVQEVEHGND